MAKNKVAQKDDWQDVEVDDWEDLPANPSAARGKLSLARRVGGAMFPPLAIANAIEEGGGSPVAASAHALDTVTLGNARYFDRAKAYLNKTEKEYPGSANIGKGAGIAGLTGASMLAGGLPAMVAAGAVQGLATKPEGENSLPEDFKKRAKNSAISATTSLAFGAAGKGLSKAGDRLMQKAVNAKEYVKGMGTRMADEGLIGTKGMMKGQIASKLPKREAELTNATRQVKGMVRPTRAWRDLLAKGDAYRPSSHVGREIPIPSENQPFINMSQQRAEEALARGSLTPMEAIDTARKVAKPAYSANGTPLDAFKHELSQAEAIALKDAVKEMADAQGIPGVRNALTSEQTLITARNGLNRPESLNEMLIRTMARGGVGAGIGAFAGSQEGGLPGGIGGALTGAAATTPMGLSLMGQFAAQGGKVFPRLSPMAISAMIKESMKEKK